jgi:DMSO/TMAO reductase YedYZ molybdopterin-dependent catalytic subunit
MPARTQPPTGGWRTRLLGALAGLVAAFAALAAGELVAAMARGIPAPRDVVGDEFIDRTPRWLKDFAIEQFGTNDKVALRFGMLATIAVLAALVGAVAVRHRWVGPAAFVASGALAAVIAVQRPTGSLSHALPPIIGTLIGAGVLLLMLDRLAPRVADGRDDAATISEATLGESWPARLRADLATTDRKFEMNRRRFFVATGAVAAVAVVGGGAARWLAQRFDVAASRAAIMLPKVAKPAVVPARAAVMVDGMTPFVTPNSSFYRIDTALVVPQVPADTWKLRVHGLVDRELEITYDALLERPAVERVITMTCVSNEVGGKLVGNATWLGVPIADILEEAGVRPGADQLKSTSADGWTAGTPVTTVTDGRDALLAYGMNGEPLPVEHGFPVRMIVPGVYGYVSATKWLTDLELTTFDAFDGYWAKRGWAPEGPIKVQSRIDVPKPLATVPAGTVAVAGVAYAQQRGIERVDVRVDGGPWSRARLAEEASIDTWRQWVWEWDATPGRHTIEVRATDADGQTQPQERVEPFPDGATGWHSVVVRVS